MFQCPSCGRSLKVIPLSDPGGGQWERGRAFALGDAPPGDYTRETPTGKADTVESGVKVPLLQAVITGGVAGVVVTIPTAIYHWPWIVPPCMAIGTFGLSWWLLLQDTRRLLRRIETFVGRDLDGDGEIGFTVEIVEDLPELKRVQYAHFPARQEQVEQFAMAALNGWLTVNSPHRLSRRKFTQLRDVAIDRGLLAWVHPDARQQGVQLTAVGRHVFKKLIA